MSTPKGLVKVLEDQIVESETGAYEVGEQRERNHRYYTLQPIGNEQKGRSHYISPDVMDAVDGRKALFDETFLSARQTVKFKNCPGLPHEADAKTAYTNKVLRKNKHHRLFRNGWHDAFVAKRMVVMVEWEKDSTTEILQLNGAMAQQIQQLIASKGGSVLGVDPTGLEQQGQVFSGPLEVELDDSHVKITLITPERYYRDPEADYPENGQWCTYEDEVSRGDLILEGFDEEQVLALAVDYRFRSNEEDSSRKAHDASWTRRQQYDRISTQSQVTVYRTWTWVNLTDDKYSDLDLGFEPEDTIALYKVCWAHGEVLRLENGDHAVTKAKRMPFLEWSEKKIAHAEHGMCTADVEAHAQKTNSTLKRLIIDNQQMTNNSRMEAVPGALRNPRDLLDNKIGGVIWTRQIGSVAPIVPPQLSPMTFNVLQMMREDSERRDGFSALGKGTNGDALRYQNADNMIERMTSAGTRRPMSSARDWAQDFLVPLCQMIIELAMEHDQSQEQLEVRGRMVPIVPSQWQDDVCDMEIATALTPQEGKEHGQLLLTMHQIMSQDPQMAGLYTVQHKHALFDSVFDAMGVEDTTPYLNRPDSPEFQQAMSQQAQKAEEERKKAESLTLLQGRLAQSADRREWERFKWSQTNDMADNNLNQEKFEHEQHIDDQENRRKWLEFDWSRKINVAELRIEEQQERPASVGN